MKKALTILAVIVTLYEVYNMWQKLERKRLIKKVTEKFGQISRLEEKSNEDLKEMLGSRAR